MGRMKETLGGQFDLFSARAKRDDGMRRVLDRDPGFAVDADEYIKALPSGWLGTGEDIRRESGLRAPHPNAWGGVIAGAFKRGWLIKTGRYVTPRAIKSHCRKIQEYRRT